MRSRKDPARSILIAATALLAISLLSVIVPTRLLAQSREIVPAPGSHAVFATLEEVAYGAGSAYVGKLRAGKRGGRVFAFVYIDAKKGEYHAAFLTAGVRANERRLEGLAIRAGLLTPEYRDGIRRLAQEAADAMNEPVEQALAPPVCSGCADPCSGVANGAITVRDPILIPVARTDAWGYWESADRGGAECEWFMNGRTTCQAYAPTLGLTNWFQTFCTPTSVRPSGWFDFHYQGVGDYKNQDFPPFTGDKEWSYATAGYQVSYTFGDPQADFFPIFVPSGQFSSFLGFTTDFSTNTDCP